MKFFISLLAFFLFSTFLLAQNNSAVLTGQVVDENNKPIVGVNIEIIGKKTSAITNDSGFFKIIVPAHKIIGIIFSHTAYESIQKNLSFSANENEHILIKLKLKSNTLDSVTVKNDGGRKETGRVQIDASKASINPSPISGIEQLIKIFVGSNNELTSQYSVRGGSYDENLIYVNDFEVFKPYLIRNGQQEGLSFINPELTSGVKFYNGGFQTKYGDKLSSVLDITYKKPKQFGGSIYLGLLEQGLHLEGITNNKKFSYLLGLRNRSNRNLLSSQATKGNYIPSSNDLQALLNYNVSNKWQVELFANTSATKFSLYPEESKLSSSVFSPFYTSNLGLDIYFDGQEHDGYSTNFLGLSAIHQPTKKIKLKWMLSAFNNHEKEHIDIMGAYLFGDRDFDKSSSTYGLINNPLGAGVFQNYARNVLDVTILDATHKGSLDKGKHFYQWGLSLQQQKINDQLNEWEYNDSAGYSLPYTGNSINLSKVLKSKTELNASRISGYVQDNIQFKDSADFTMQIGVRYNYNTLNKEFLLSPRMGISFVPKKWKKDVVIKASLGLYHQPPFYREMRDFNGNVNTQLKAQKSWQASIGADYNFKLFNRPARFATEAYYKSLWDVVPYDVDNVRLKYFATNNAKAFAVGVEGRLFAEVVKDAESWVSVGIMKTKENLDNDSYIQYQLDANNKPVPIGTVDVGWLRRPTDRLLTFGMFFQDYLSTNKNIKVYLNGLYGSNLPYNIPNSVRYRNAMIIDPYIRLDIGFSALLLDGEKSMNRSRSPFKNFQSIWASLELFNAIDRPNTISYMLIKDFQNNIIAMPNRLTPRLINLKVMVKW